MDADSLIFDDVGSFPLPKGCRIDDLSLDGYMDVVRGAMALKVEAGVEVPNYPQFRDMIGMFSEIILDPNLSDSPYLVKKDQAEILELEAVEDLHLKRVRVCVTGPIELYLSIYGATAYTDVLFTLAESVSRFIERAVGRGYVPVVSIDEPSLGISPNVAFSENDIIRALDIASRPCRGISCEVHLHSPLMVETCSRVKGINIVGVESAAHPDYLQIIDRKVLEETETGIRAGIARTDILAMVARQNDLHGINLWDHPATLEREIMGMESVDVILGRIRKAHALFGDSLLAVGPDCGLGSWPSQGMAQMLLSNCARAVASFRKEVAGLG